MTDNSEEANNQQLNDESVAISGLAVFGASAEAKSLLEKVDELQEEAERHAIERLGDERILLQNCIARYRRHWKPIFKLVREAFEATVLMNIALEEWRRASADAEAEWNFSLQTVDFSERQNESLDT